MPIQRSKMKKPYGQSNSRKSFHQKLGQIARKLIFVSVFIKLLIFKLQWSEAASLLSNIPYTAFVTFAVIRVDVDPCATFPYSKCKVTDSACITIEKFRLEGVSGIHLVQTCSKQLCIRGTNIQVGNLETSCLSLNDQYDLRKPA